MMSEREKAIAKYLMLQKDLEGIGRDSARKHSEMYALFHPVFKEDFMAIDLLQARDIITELIQLQNKGKDLNKQIIEIRKIYGLAEGEF